MIYTIKGLSAPTINLLFKAFKTSFVSLQVALSVVNFI